MKWSWGSIMTQKEFEDIINIVSSEEVEFPKGMFSYKSFMQGVTQIKFQLTKSMLKYYNDSIRLEK